MKGATPRASCPRWSAALAALLCRRAAEAHLVTTGLGPVYDGISHVLDEPGRSRPNPRDGAARRAERPKAGRRTLFAVTCAWLVGGVAGFSSGTRSCRPRCRASFLVLGALIAADLRLSPRLVTALAVAVGVLHGWLNGAGIAESQREVLGLAGIATVVFVLVALLSAFVVSLRAAWARIVVRVAGSWVAAIGLLMLGMAPSPGCDPVVARVLPKRRKPRKAAARRRDDGPLRPCHECSLDRRRVQQPRNARRCPRSRRQES